MHKWLLGVGLAVMLATMPMSVMAGVQDFKIVNKTGFTIQAVYVSESENENWEDDVLGEDVLPTGKSTTIRFNGYDENTCDFDIRVEDEDGKAWEIDEVDLCQTRVVTLKMKDGKLIYTEK